MKLRIVCLFIFVLATPLCARELPPPIIDMHLHAMQVGEFEHLAGTAPIPHCEEIANHHAH